MLDQEEKRLVDKFGTWLMVLKTWDRIPDLMGCLLISGLLGAIVALCLFVAACHIIQESGWRPWN